eukprot:5059397-Alexandrium_andersonii.AAC.1
MQRSAALSGFVQLCAPLGALSRWLRAPRGAQSRATPPRGAESCTLQPSAASGCRRRLGLFGGA